jgi:hypothetical protein
MRYYLEYDIYEIKNLSKEKQIEIMENWFLSNYQNPEDECPYDSEEGDYVYIYGGPYDAREKLEDQFEEYVDKSIIDELVNKLENRCFEWSGIDFDFDSEFDEIKIDPLENLRNSIITLQDLLEIDYDINAKETVYNMISANCITILEAFLSEYLLTKVLGNNFLLRNLIEKITDFEKEIFSINQIFQKYEDITNYAKTYLSNLSYHNLAKISKIYEQIFSVKFPMDIGFIYKMIERRHDIIHRNGKRKDGIKIVSTKNDIKQLLSEIGRLAEFINENMTSPDHEGVVRIII